MKQENEEEAVYKKRYPAKGEFPKIKDGEWVDTSLGDIKFFSNHISNGIWRYNVHTIEWWLEPIPLHSLIEEGTPTEKILNELQENVASWAKDARSGGRAGCTYGDTKFDSLSAHYGETVAYENIIAQIDKIKSRLTDKNKSVKY